MIYHFTIVGSFLLVASASLYTMNNPMSQELTIQKSTALAALPRNVVVSVIHQLVATNKQNSALPIALLSYKLYRQQLQQQNNINQRSIRLILANNQVELTPEHSIELTQASATIRNIIHDIEEQIEEIPLPLLTQEQAIALLAYIPSINALNTSTSTLPMLQQEIPKTILLSSYYLKYIALQQLKEHLTAQTIPMLCDLLIAASYLDIQSDQKAINFIELTTQALGDKLVQAPVYQAQYNVITTLPNDIQRMLAYYLIHTSRIQSIFCGKNTDTIINTAQTIISNDANSSVSWSPDSSKLAISSYDTVRIWNANTGTCIHTLEGHTDKVASVSWSPDSSKLATGSHEMVRIWDATTNNCIHTLTGHTGWVNSVSWSPDSTMIASWSKDHTTITLWSTVTGTYIRTLKGHTGFVNLVSWSPDGRYIASSSDDRRVIIWDAQSGLCIHILTDYRYRNKIISVSWSSDSMHIAICSQDDTVKIWDVATGTCIQTLTGHTDRVNSVSWSPDGKHIASGSHDDTVKIWDVSSGTCKHILRDARRVKIIAWSPDDSQLVSSSDHETKIWNVLDKSLINYLQTTLSWEQALLLVHIINAHDNQQDIDFTHDTKALQCYNSLDQRVKQLVEPLLSEKTRTTVHNGKIYIG